MNGGPSSPASNPARIASSLIVGAIVAGFLFTAYQYGERTAAFPLVVGWATFVLCVVDLVASTPTRIGTRLTAFLHRPRAEEGGADSTVRREIASVAWLGAMVALVAAFGFLVAIPVYTFAFMMLRGGYPVLRAGLVAGLTTVVLYAVFEWLLRYELYRGLVFG